MFLSDDREDPSRSTDAERKEHWLATYRSVLDPEALPERHVLRQLWERKDFFATFEILTIGASLDRLARQQNFLKNLVREMRGNDHANVLAAVHEVTAAAFFHDRANPATLTKQNNPGYDFAIELPQARRVRVSCKLRMPSAEETQFFALSDLLFETFATSMPPRTHIRSIFTWRGDVLPPLGRSAIESHRWAIEQASVGFAKTGRGEAIGSYGTKVVLLPLVAPRGVALWDDIGSYSQTSLFGHGPHEQKRVLNQLKAGIEGFQKHYGAREEHVANVILLKIGDTVRWDVASPLIVAALESAPLVSAVYLLRRRIVGSVDKPRARHAETELAEIQNPVAWVPIRSLLPDGETIRANAPLGAVTMRESALHLLRDGEPNAIELRDTYVAARTRLYVIPLTGTTIDLAPDTEIHLVQREYVRGPWRTSGAISGPRSRLVAV